MSVPMNRSFAIPSLPAPNPSYQPPSTATIPADLIQGRRISHVLGPDDFDLELGVKGPKVSFVTQQPVAHRGIDVATRTSGSFVHSSPRLSLQSEYEVTSTRSSGCCGWLTGIYNKCIESFVLGTLWVPYCLVSGVGGASWRRRQMVGDWQGAREKRREREEKCGLYYA